MFIICESGEACRSDFPHFFLILILKHKQRSLNVKTSLFSIKCGLISWIKFSWRVFSITEPVSESDEIVYIDTNAEKSVLDFEKFKNLPEMVGVDHEEIVKTEPFWEIGRSSLSSEEKSIEKLPCPVCGKLFNKWFDIKRHMSTHTGEKPFTVKIL